jgi:signal transduction histidine kinase
MSSGTVRRGRPKIVSAAWRISLWATLAFACGTMLVFLFLHRFLANDYQRRNDAWISGELGVLTEVANRTPPGALYGRVVREVAELASREIPDRNGERTGVSDAVFFLQTRPDGSLGLWVGTGDGGAALRGIRASRLAPAVPFHLQVRDRAVPFRVVSAQLKNGGTVYLGLSEHEQLRILRNLRIRFLVLWLAIVLLGFAIVFLSTRRMLDDVREITEAASRIGESDLSQRVPTSRRNDEVAQLALTLNRMLDRIERSIAQLHTITDSLAHDLRSPLTAIRAKLEMSLSGGTLAQDADSIVCAIDELDRLSEILNTSLDVAEAQVDALRMQRTAIDLDDLLRSMIHLYEPCMSEKGIRIELASAGPVEVFADAALLHRTVANLFDNEWKHLPAACTVQVALSVSDGSAVLLLEDDGPGFAPEIGSNLFKARVKGRDSGGYGLGLAFVEAVVGAHSGSLSATNRPQGGAQLRIVLPLAEQPSAVAAGVLVAV